MRSNGAWKVNESEVFIYRKVKTLQILKADEQQMGKYSCRAANSIGVAERHVQVYREYKTLLMVDNKASATVVVTIFTTPSATS